MPKAKPTPAPEPGANSSMVIGMALLAVSIGTSMMLVLQHLAGMALPGCGIGSPCAELSASVWGKVPVFHLPTSSAGLAYFIAVLIGWIVSRGRPTAAFLWIVRLGAVISITLLTVIIVKKQLCMYCLAAHVGNLLFWMLAERSPRVSKAVPRTAASIIVSFIVCAAALGGIEWQRGLKIARDENAQKEQSIKDMIAKGQQATIATNPAATSTAPAATRPTTREFIAGRWHEGPAVAPIRIVIFSDYQCTDCRNIEMQLRSLMSSRNDISVTHKHFPFCSDCNKHLNIRMHENACWAARAAEAAGIMRGQAGFHQMHQWLFDRGGAFTNPELNAALTQMGYDTGQFNQTMQSAATLKPIAEDCDEAIALGLFFTPMVFINGVELRGYRTPNALIDAVTRLAATNPPALGVEADRPATAVEKGIEDWRQQRILPLDSMSRMYPLGATDPAKAAVKFVIFGDLQDPATASLDEMIRKAIAGRSDARYVFRNFPFDQACNPIPNTTKNPLACRAARAMEAAGNIAGTEAYWKVQAWLLANTSKYRQDNATPDQNASFRTQFDAALREALTSMGLNPDAVFATMEDPAVTTGITEDINMARAAGLNNLPSLFLNNRQVVRWTINDEVVLDRLVKEAATLK